MTFCVTLGCDPGNSGAIAILADGDPVGFVDIPKIERDIGSGYAVDVHALAALVRGVMQQHPGAHFAIALEYVNGHSPGGRGDDKRRLGNATGARFMESYGAIKGVLGALGLRWTLVMPQKWKKHHGLIGKEKDDARLHAIAIAPAIADRLKRKKDGGRADALLIALWAHQTGIAA